MTLSSRALPSALCYAVSKAGDRNPYTPKVSILACKPWISLNQNQALEQHHLNLITAWLFAQSHTFTFG